jgi:DNA invertase Pin-like site-specific DNA recombinase
VRLFVHKSTRKRQREGIEAAKRQGKVFGRPKAQITDPFMTAYHEWKAGDITATQAMQQSNVKKQRSINWLNK